MLSLDLHYCIILPKNAKMTKNTKNSIKLMTKKTERTKLSNFFELG